MTQRKIPTQCPVCGAANTVTEVSCTECETQIRGRFEMCRICTMSGDLYDFTLTFLKARGNIKEVEKLLGISYPTVRNRLDQVLAYLELHEPDDRLPDTDAKPSPERMDILKKIETGDISPTDAIKLLKNQS